ncbi:MAG: SET domain-containing protein [Bdellovibrionota bacterium]
MIHPNIQLRWLSDAKGYGLIAIKSIPAGSITFAQDPLDIAIPTSSHLLEDQRIKKYIEKYAFLNSDDEFVISWDNGKYMNHCCHANTLTTGYGFEIAIADIAEGEEVTDDYGIFTIRHHMEISCSKENCRGKISIEDFDRCLPCWDEKVMKALKLFNIVDQPLKEFINDKVLSKITKYIETGDGYVSVGTQKANVEEFEFWTEGQ